MFSELLEGISYRERRRYDRYRVLRMASYSFAILETAYFHFLKILRRRGALHPDPDFLIVLLKILNNAVNDPRHGKTSRSAHKIRF